MTVRAALAAFFILIACNGSPPPPSCPALAAPACPDDNGADVCADLTCASVYACSGGRWTFVRDCPSYSPEAGVHPIEAGDDAGIASGIDASIDGEFGGPGCIELEMPDCSLGTALGCVGTLDCCGCEDVFVCQNGGWELWGQCTADAGVVKTTH